MDRVLADHVEMRTRVKTRWRKHRVVRKRHRELFESRSSVASDIHADIDVDGKRERLSIDTSELGEAEAARLQRMRAFFGAAHLTIPGLGR